MNEIWKPILNFPGYEVSNFGRVRSYHAHRGAIRKRHHLLKPAIEKRNNGAIPYPRVSLCIDKKGHKRTIHRLVLEAFIGPCPSGLEACHNDGDYLNPRLDNLRWDTRQSNMNDCKKHNTALVGERHPNAKLTAVQVLDIRQRYDNGETTQALSVAFGVGLRTISRITLGQGWRNVGGPIHQSGSVIKARSPRGDKNPTHLYPELYRGEHKSQAKLTEEQVLEIRERYATAEPSQDIATAFGISRSTIRHIASGLKWSHVGGPRTKRRSRYWTHYQPTVNTLVALPTPTVG